VQLSLERIGTRNMADLSDVRLDHHQATRDAIDGDCSAGPGRRRLE
jgi:hypothetical protein